jgi:hypothetical protein
MSNMDSEYGTGTGTGASAEKTSKAEPLSKWDRDKSEAARKNKKLKEVLGAWSQQAKDERNLRKLYAKLLIGALFFQIALVNLAFFLIGWGYLNVDEWTARTFVIAVFLELSAMVFFIVKYLFAPQDKNILDLIENL